MNTFVLLGTFSGIAVSLSLFLASYFFFIRTEDTLRNRLLGFLFLSIALRIGKSIFYYLLPDIAAIGVAAGFIGLASIGPFTLLYHQFSTEEDPKFSGLYYLHFVLPVIGFFTVWLFNPGYHTIIYISATFVLAGYIGLNWIIWIRNRGKHPKLNYWNLIILTGVTFIWSSLVYQHLSGSMIDYAYGAALASLVVYVQFFFILKNPTLFPRASEKSIHLVSKEQLRKALEEERLYEQSALTLNEFAAHLGIPSYLVSKAVNEYYGKTFPELINYYRVEAVKEKLISADHRTSKIEGLAYDVGFNTPSAFYAAFKKETAMSPKEFRKQAVI